MVTKRGASMGVVSGAKGVVKGVATVVGVLLLLVFGSWMNGCWRVSDSGGSGSQASSATATPGLTTYSNSAHGYSFESSQELQVVASGAQKGNTPVGVPGAKGLGKWWHSSYAPRSSDSGPTFNFDVSVLTLPISIPDSGKFGASYQAKTSLSLELYGYSKKKSIAGISQPKQVDLDSSPAWASGLRETWAAGDTASVLLYAWRKNREYRLEFTAAQKNWDEAINRVSEFLATFKLD